MAYVKNYNPGHIRLDLPSANYIYELPLFSFKDTFGSLGISLIFNFSNASDSNDTFLFKPGYKLNIFKRLIMSGDIPVYYQDGYGKKISIIKHDNSGFYFFDDESRRYIKKSGSYYNLFYPDNSKDVFYGDGSFVMTVDKYGQTIFECGFSQARLSSITYRTMPYRVLFTYDTEGRISRASFLQNYADFTYTNTGINVTYKSGESVVLESNGYNFTARAGDLSSGTVLDCKRTTRITEENDGCTVTVKNTVFDVQEGTTTSVENITDSSSYEFPDILSDYDLYHPLVEITDFYGVKTRVQYQRDKAEFSYEVNGDDVSFIQWGSGKYRFTGSVSSLQADNSTGTVSVSGKQLLRDGLSMKVSAQSPNLWEVSVDPYPNEDKAGYYVLTGWYKANLVDVLYPYVEIGAGNVIGYFEDFQLIAAPYNRWKYFSLLLNLESQRAYLNLKNSANIELKDLRLTYREDLPVDEIDEKTGKTHFAIYEEGLLYHEGGQNTFIPLEDCTFLRNSAEITSFNDIYFDDVLKNKINYKNGINTTEFFYDKCRNFISKAASDTINVSFKSGETTVTRPLGSFYAATKRYSNELGYITTYVIDNDNNAFLIYNTVDEAGNVLSSQTLDNKLDVASTTEKKITTEYTRDNTGRIINEVKRYYVDQSNVLYERTTTYGADANNHPTIALKDEFNNITTYTIDRLSGNVLSVAMPDGSIVTEAYDDSKGALTERVMSKNTDNRSILFGYNKGNLTALSSGSLGYEFGYKKDELVSVKGEAALEEYEYNTDSSTAYYPSSDNYSYKITTNYDKYRRITSVDGLISNEYDIKSVFNSSGTLIHYGNNGDALLVEDTDLVRGTKSRYEYDEKNRLVKKSATSSSDYSSKEVDDEFTYDGVGRLSTHNTTIYDQISTLNLNERFIYRSDVSSTDSAISMYIYKNGDTELSSSVNSFDTLNRLTEKAHQISYGRFTKNFTYDKTRVTTVVDSYRYDEDYDEIGRYTYEYDVLGRISETTYNTGASNKTISYSYDNFGQIKREDNQATGKTVVYNYDTIGNINGVSEYTYTTAETPTNPTSTKSFVYDSTHKDRLINYNGNAITYNNAGYLSSYNGKNYTWQRGKLSGITKGNPKLTTGDFEITSFTYDGYGQRVTKSYKYESSMVSLENSNPIRVTQYSYDHSGRIVKETCTETFKNSTTTNTHRIVYLYDESGVIGLMYGYNTTALQPYYYQRNLQGDVVAIRNTSGNKVAEYAYDAWGNCTVVSSTNATLAYYNPIRYRGYYLDRETGFYYLNARYYNPEWRRFISHDDTSYLDPENFSGLNLYAYCYNDPVNYADPSGRFAVSLLVGTLVAFGIGFTGSAISQYCQYDGEINWIQAGIDGLFAAGSSLLAYTGINLAASIIAGALMGMGQYTLDSAVFHDDFSWSGFITAGVLGGIGGFVSGRGAQHYKSIGSNLDETGRTGVKAILTAYDRYGKGTGYQKVLNLWGGRVANSLAKSISANYTSSIFKIWIATGVTYGISYGIGKGLNLLGVNF